MYSTPSTLIFCGLDLADSEVRVEVVLCTVEDGLSDVVGLVPLVPGGNKLFGVGSVAAPVGVWRGFVESLLAGAA